MSSIFISHKNIPHDNDWAARIHAWIKDQIDIDGFLDFNIQHGLQAGSNWENEIYAAMNRAQVVIALMSSDWIKSDWCMSEARMAKLRGLQLIPALIDDCKNPFGEIQHIDFTNDEELAFEQLKERLKTTHKLPKRPYPGLAAFQEDDAAIFFGRDDETHDLINQVNSLFNGRPVTPRLLLVLGASGSGKSSLVRAGLLPSFNADPTQIAIEPIIPRGNPLKELGRALETTFDGPNPETNAEYVIAALKQKNPAFKHAIITVDQAEELLRSDNNAFFKVTQCLLKRGDGNIVLLATMRSDFLNEFQQSGLIGAGSALDYDTFTIDPMPTERLSDIIRKPAKLYDIDYEDKLIDQLNRDHGGPDALPLLAFFLSEFWQPDYIKDGKLQLTEYNDFGGISKALSKAVQRSLFACRKLDQIYTDDKKLLDDLKEVFLGSLVSISSISGEPIRNRVPTSALSDKQTDLLTPFEQQRLLIKKYDEWEVVHEALFRQWVALKQWIEEAREDLLTIDRVNTAAKQWHDGGHEQPDLTHTGDRLSGAIKLNRSIRYKFRFSPDDIAYLDACAKKDRDELEKERKARELERSLREQAQKESARAQKESARAQKESIRAQEESVRAHEESVRAQKGENKAKTYTKIAAAIALVALTAGGLAIWQWNNAGKAATQAVQNESRALVALAETALANDNYFDALKLGLASWPRNQDDPRLKLRNAALGIVSGTRRVFSNRSILPTPPRHEGRVEGAVFNKAETRILTWSVDGTAQLWDAETGKPLFDQPLHHEDWVNGAVFNKEETRILTWSGDGTAQLWDAETGKPLFDQPPRHEGDVIGAVFNRAETRILTWSGDPTGSSNGTAQLWDAETGKSLFDQPLHHEGRVNGAVFNKAETRILTWSGDPTGSSNGSAQLWDAETGKPLFDQPLHHEGRVNGAVFNKAETRILTWSGDDTAQLWDAETGNPLFDQPPRHEGDVIGAVFNRAETRILTWSGDDTAQLWDAETGKPLFDQPPRHEDDVNGAVFNKAETRILTWSGNPHTSSNGTAQLWDAETGKPLFDQPPRHESDDIGAVFNKAETRILTWSGDLGGLRNGTAQLWDAETGKPLFDQPPWHEDVVNGAVFNKEETRILTWSDDGTAKLWDAETGKLLFDQPPWHEDVVNGAVFNKEETRILTWSDDGTAKLWDVETGKPLFDQPPRHEGDVIGAVFNRAETRILTWSGDPTGSSNGTAQLWDAETGKPLFDQPPWHEDVINGAVFNKEETRILTWSDDGTAQLWDAETGKSLFDQPLHHEGRVNGAVFNKAETRILTWSGDPTGSSNGTAQLWDAETGKPLFDQPPRHEDVVIGAVFNKAETRILTWSGDGSAQLWSLGRLPEGNLIDVACRMFPEREAPSLGGLEIRYGIAITEPICGPDTPAPNALELVD